MKIFGRFITSYLHMQDFISCQSKGLTRDEKSQQSLYFFANTPLPWSQRLFLKVFLRESENDPRSGEEREKNLWLPWPRFSLKINLWDQGDRPLCFVAMALRFAHVLDVEESKTKRPTQCINLRESINSSGPIYF